MSMAKHGDMVRVHYTGRLTDGTIFDSSFEGEPLEFTVGDGRVIPGFEGAIEGMKVGEFKTVEIAADDAFGPYRPEMVMQVERSKFPPDMELYAGQQLQVQRSDEVFPVTIVLVGVDAITLDANHPLAGKDLVSRSSCWTSRCRRSGSGGSSRQLKRRWRRERGASLFARFSRVASSQTPGAGYILALNNAIHGDVAQLGERLNRIQEVEGSTPFVSTAEKARKTGPFAFWDIRPSYRRQPRNFANELE